MNLSELKEIIEKEGGKIVIVEQDKPTLVIMAFEEWRGKRRVIEQAEPAQRPEAVKAGEELTIDDLPL